MIAKAKSHLKWKDGEYPYSITEIFENNEFNTKEILTQY